MSETRDWSVEEEKRTRAAEADSRLQRTLRRNCPAKRLMNSMGARKRAAQEEKLADAGPGGVLGLEYGKPSYVVSRKRQVDVTVVGRVGHCNAPLKTSTWSEFGDAKLETPLTGEDTLSVRERIRLANAAASLREAVFGKDAFLLSEEEKEVLRLTAGVTKGALAGRPTRR